MKSLKGAVLLAVLLLAQSSMADDISFSHKDWELVCDNTGTCWVGCQQGSSSSLMLRSMKLL